MQTIIVLGMHRSGSSIIGGILHSLGVDMGDDAFGSTAYNPTGHFEDKLTVKINNQLLNEAGGSWSDPPDRSKIIEHGISQVDHIKEITSQRIGDFIGYKDPRMALTMDLWLPYLVNPICILCKRDELEIAQSLRTRNGFSIMMGLQIARHYQSEIDGFLERNRNIKVMTVAYRTLCVNPLHEISNIVSFLGIPAGHERLIDASKAVVSRDNIKKQRIIHKLRKAIKSPDRVIPYISERVNIFIKSFTNKKLM